MFLVPFNSYVYFTVLMIYSYIIISWTGLFVFSSCHLSVCVCCSGCGAAVLQRLQYSQRPRHRGVWRHLADAAVRNRSLPDRLHTHSQIQRRKQQREAAQVRLSSLQQKRL